MGVSKSELEFYSSVWFELHQDIAQCYNVAPKELKAERAYARSRLDQEGISFLTKTLPSLAKSVDKALSTGTNLTTLAFRKKGQGAIPKFIGWLLALVFDSEGRELVNSCPYALKNIRQLLYPMYKLEIQHDKETERSLLSQFVDVDKELPGLPGISERSDYSGVPPWLSMARGLISRVISSIRVEDIRPKHGPGAVATGESVTEKSIFKRIYPRTERTFPFTEYMCYSLEHVVRGALDYVELQTEPPTAKVVLVPKDSRGPRVISCEPLELQWLQQGVSRLLVDRIESYPLTKGYVNFTHQHVNRDLALESSRTQANVTLDMKEASDRVSLELVQYLFSGHPAFLEALLATRSEQTLLPNGNLVKLRKFAPMGSALCFPVEALIFWALSVSVINIVGKKSRREALRSVYVYGDDIICRRKDYPHLLQHLPTVGLMFNGSKCCVAGFFRESCGMDAYKGVCVTPVRLRTTISRNQDPNELCSYVALYNAMFGLAHYGVCSLIEAYLVRKYGKIPTTSYYEVASNGAFVSLASAPMLVAHKRSIPVAEGFRTRWHKKYQYQLVMSWRVESVKARVPRDTYWELLRRTSEDFGSRGSYAIPRRMRLVRGWCKYVP